MKRTTTSGKEANLALLLRALKLPSFVAAYEEYAQQAERQGWSCIEYLRRLV